MKFGLTLIVLIPRLLWAGACCLGGGPKSFVLLRPLQSYELGVSTSFKDNFGRYNSYGDLVATEKNQSYNVLLGGTARLTIDTDAFVIVPWVWQFKESLNATQSRQTLGDILVGVRYHLLDNLFEDEWYPKIQISLGVKVPSGKMEALDELGQITPGTGNGIWEPSLGVTAQKDYGFVIVSVSPAYVWRLGRSFKSAEGVEAKLNEGDRIELTESLTFPITREWSVAVGSEQSWTLSKKINGSVMSDTQGRGITGFISTGYYLTRFWSLGLGFDSALPLSRWGVNQPATRTISLTSNYSIF